MFTGLTQPKLKFGARGFIQPDDGRNRVYYNSAAVVGGVGLFWGDRVSYFLGAAPDYRLRACEVTLLGTRG